MSRNIKEIGKELLGKSLNSYHRRTGLTQLEKNNEMQDGILNGILSQVDDAYIEKTEQSNVLHLDGSGDGVVVLDGIEGNTMVNLASLRRMTRFASTGNMVCDYDGIYYKGSFYNTYYVSSIAQQPLSTLGMQQGKTYTLIQYQKLDKSIYNDDTTTPRQSGFIFYDKSSDTSVHLGKDALSEMINVGETKITKTKFTVDSRATHFDLRLFTASKSLASKEVSFSYWFILLEGDYTNKEVNFFEGLQSSFEEKINDEGKYEIDILSQNRNLLNRKNIRQGGFTWAGGVYHSQSTDRCCTIDYIKVKSGLTLYRNRGCTFILYDKDYNHLGNDRVGNKGAGAYPSTSYVVEDGVEYIHIVFNPSYSNSPSSSNYDNVIISYTPIKDYVDEKHNKIKLLINEPLRAIGDIKDKLCIKDDRLVIERNCKEIILDGSRNWAKSNVICNSVYYYYSNFNVEDAKGTQLCLCNNIRSVHAGNIDEENIFIWSTKKINIGISKNKLSTDSVDSFKQLLQSNPIKMVYELAEPYYEEVLNEYGEPILLEGYENGTLYIDSTIIPTTSVRYTPKMESLNTLKEVNNNNVMLTNDINDMIVPYMMKVDLMIMEKEVALMSQKNIRKIGAEDMTSMQKRTYDMLARLIKGKTLTVDECKTRVTVYLNAGKITDEQAKELNFLIDEIYA